MITNELDYGALLMLNDWLVYREEGNDSESQTADDNSGDNTSDSESEMLPTTSHR